MEVLGHQRGEFVSIVVKNAEQMLNGSPELTKGRIEVIELADIVGVSRNSLSQIERGAATNLSQPSVAALSVVLGMSPEKRVTDNPALNQFTHTARLPEEDARMLLAPATVAGSRRAWRAGTCATR